MPDSVDKVVLKLPVVEAEHKLVAPIEHGTASGEPAPAGAEGGRSDCRMATRGLLLRVSEPNALLSVQASVTWGEI